MSQDPPDKDPLIGSVVDRRYKVLKRLGVGGMGIVYKVEHSYLNKFFALKVMRTTKDETDRKRFEQEARLASQIRHPNVVEISDFGVLPTSQPYFVMEFLRGHTIGDAIYTGFIDSQLICHIGVQISRGLQAVHKQNVVHRDLKPDNIFLIDPEAAEATESPDGNDDSAQAEPAFVKIMDFGIAKSMNNNLTGTGMTVGTPEYMSPEQARGEPV
ncbi:MAG: serine/threonine protein kinase, partial [Deltaproteobacteria bacterium]|nr:serine/threonine protein kinase [Deltaproteobacteria bacterium]